MLFVTGAHDSVENYADLFTVALRNDNIQEFDTQWDEMLSVTQIPSDDILENLYKLRIREFEKLRTVLEMYGDNSAKNTRQVGCVFQDMKPPKSSSILRKSSNIRKPIRCVKFTKAVERHAKIRDQNPSLGMVCPGDPHQRNPNTPKFEDRSQEETEREERYAREPAWKMARCILKLEEKHKTTFFSPSENWCLPAPSTIKPEEREFVVDSGASMHMISKKDLNSNELETVTTSRSPTTNSQW